MSEKLYIYLFICLREEMRKSLGKCFAIERCVGRSWLQGSECWLAGDTGREEPRWKCLRRREVRKWGRFTEVRLAVLISLCSTFNHLAWRAVVFQTFLTFKQTAFVFTGILE